METNMFGRNNDLAQTVGRLEGQVQQIDRRIGDLSVSMDQQHKELAEKMERIAQSGDQRTGELEKRARRGERLGFAAFCVLVTIGAAEGVISSGLLRSILGFFF